MAGDLILKQLIAVIDRRTTPVCLNANGQIRPIDKPYDTLNGDYDSPPFHVHCRSMSVPWMPGFVNDARAQANDEIMRRTAKQRALIDGRQPMRHIPDPKPLSMREAVPSKIPSAEAKAKYADFGPRADRLAVLDADPAMTSMKADLLAGPDGLDGLASAMTKMVKEGLPPGWSTEVETRWTGGRGVVRVKLLDDEGFMQGVVVRKFMLDQDGVPEVDHSLFRLGEKVQGQGIATRVNAALEDWYVVNGVQSIYVEANIDVGGYAWARRGFDWDTRPQTVDLARRQAKDVLTRIMQAIPDNGLDRLRFAEEWMPKFDGPPETWPTPYDLSQIGWKPGAENWIGRTGMLGTSWNGVRSVRPR